MGRIKWTEKKIDQLVREGRGLGTGADYQPWLDVRSFSSMGRSRRVFSPKTNRMHHLFSDIEYRLFLALEWQDDIVDIREQFPLDRAVTQDLAQKLGIRHPYYPGTFVPTVMTADFVVTRDAAGLVIEEAFNAKSLAESCDERAMEKLRLQNAYFDTLGIKHHVVFDSAIPLQRVKNLDWIRDGLRKANEVERFDGFWQSMSAKLLRAFDAAANDNRSLTDFCSHFDAMEGADKGTGMRTARMLLAGKQLKVDLSVPDIPALPAKAFSVAQHSGLEGE